MNYLDYWTGSKFHYPVRCELLSLSLSLFGNDDAFGELLMISDIMVEFFGCGSFELMIFCLAFNDLFKFVIIFLLSFGVPPTELLLSVDTIRDAVYASLPLPPCFPSVPFFSLEL